MRVHFLSADKTTVEICTIEAPESAPNWLAITLGDRGGKIIAVPPEHPLDGDRVECGTGREIVDAITRYLVGDIRQDVAEQAIATSLNHWCREHSRSAASHPSSNT